MGTCQTCGACLNRRQKLFCSRKCTSLNPEWAKRGAISRTGKRRTAPSPLKGIKRPEYVGRKISIAKTGKKRNPFTEEHKRKIGLARSGERAYQWIKDRTKLKRHNNPAKDRRSYAYNYWRKQVWLRDDFKCKIANPDCEGRLEAHHILSYTNYPELRYQINNGITLCHFHHPRKREEEKRLSPYFQGLVSVSSE